VRGDEDRVVRVSGGDTGGAGTGTLISEIVSGIVGGQFELVSPIVHS
jgi:hypothetical protein